MFDTPGLTNKDPNIHWQPKSSTDINCLIPIDPLILSIHYMGTWYEIEKLPAAFERGECVQATYSRLPDGMVKVYNEELLPDGKINSIEGVAEVKDPSQPAILSVSFFKGNIVIVFCSPYWVLSTDYKSYSLVYSCSDYLSLFHIDFAWILARTRVLSEDFVNQLRGKLEAAGVNIKQLTVTNQTDCAGHHTFNF
uniref:Apolipoprotein D n=1 Tax=Sphaeramia orbicularis TaxID=375764 RepID=A0A673CZB1_9TELE